VACIYAAFTLQREAVWQKNLTLWRDTGQKNPYSYNAALGRGYALERLGRPAEAIPEFQQAVQLSRGEEASPYAGMAIALDAIGRGQEADAAYRRSVELDPRFKNPDAVIKALIWEYASREKLERLARRN
jgi:Flp pilus assembly protein TadD